MKILYDAQIFINQKKGGISRYHYELFKRMRSGGHDAVIAGKFIKNGYLLDDKHYGRQFRNDPTSSFALLSKIAIRRAIKKPAMIFFIPQLPATIF